MRCSSISGHARAPPISLTSAIPRERSSTSAEHERGTRTRPAAPASLHDCLGDDVEHHAGRRSSHCFSRPAGVVARLAASLPFAPRFLGAHPVWPASIRGKDRDPGDSIHEPCGCAIANSADGSELANAGHARHRPAMPAATREQGRGLDHRSAKATTLSRSGPIAGIMPNHPWAGRPTPMARPYQTRWRAGRSGEARWPGSSGRSWSYRSFRPVLLREPIPDSCHHRDRTRTRAGQLFDGAFALGRRGWRSDWREPETPAYHDGGARRSPGRPGRTRSSGWIPLQPDAGLQEVFPAGFSWSARRIRVCHGPRARAGVPLGSRSAGALFTRRHSEAMGKILLMASIVMGQLRLHPNRFMGWYGGEHVTAAWSRFSSSPGPTRRRSRAPLFRTSCCDRAPWLPAMRLSLPALFVIVIAIILECGWHGSDRVEHASHGSHADPGVLPFHPSGDLVVPIAPLGFVASPVPDPSSGWSWFRCSHAPESGHREGAA